MRCSIMVWNMKKSTTKIIEPDSVDYRLTHLALYVYS